MVELLKLNRARQDDYQVKYARRYLGVTGTNQTEYSTRPLLSREFSTSADNDHSEFNNHNRQYNTQRDTTRIIARTYTCITSKLVVITRWRQRRIF